MEKAFVPDDEKYVVNFIFFVEVFYLKDIIVEKGVLNMTEKEKMEAEIELLHAKKDAARAEVERGELYKRAVEAMRRYQGADDYPEDVEIDEGFY